MNTRSLVLHSSIAVLALGWFGRAEAQGPLFFRHIAGDVIAVRVTPDGSRVVFLADLDEDEQFELFSAPTDGSAAPVQLNSRLVAGGDVSWTFAISPDGQHVAFLADGDTDTVTDLYCARVDGTASVVRVSAGAGLEFVLGFLFTPDSEQLVFEARTIDQRNEIWCARLNGTSVREVSGDMAPGGNTLGNYHVSPDSTRLVFLADAVTDGLPEIFGVPLDGSGPVVKLSPTPVAGGNAQGISITPDGARVVYLVDQSTDNVFELYSVPIDGSAAAMRISTLAGALRDVEPDFAFTPDGHVVYRADHDRDNSRELYLVPADGSAAALKLNASLAVGESCDDFAIGADGHLVYRADQDTNDVFELYAVPLDGSKTTVKLSGAMTSGGDVQISYQLSPDGTRVVYRADQDTDEIFELYGAPLDGSGAAVKLNPALAPGRSVSLAPPIDPGGTFVLFVADLYGDNDNELLAAPIDGSSPAVVLNDQGMAFPTNGGSSFGFAQDGAVVYRGVLDPDDVDFVEQLFVVPLDASAAPLVLHPRPALGELDGDILDYRLTHDGESVVYLAREKQGRGLYLAPLSEPASPLRLTGSTVLQYGFVIGADDQRVAFLWTTIGTGVTHELYTVPLDGGALPVKLSGTMISTGDVQNDFAFTPDATRVVYRADAVEDGRYELYSAPADGSAAATQLCGALVANGDVLSFRLSPDNVHLVYLADQDVDTRPELYSVPVDGSAAPVKLNGVLPLSAQVQDDYRIHPDGSRVFYRADEDLHTAYELHSVPIDGSAPATEINGPLTSGGKVLEYQLDAAGGLVVYRAVQDSYHIELYSAPSDASAAPVKLSPALVNQGNIGSYALAADGSRVAFDGQVAINGVVEVWSAPTDGSAPAVRLHDALTGEDDASLAALTPDGARVLYYFKVGINGPNHLYTVPVDASSNPVRIHKTVVQGQNIWELAVSPDSSRVVYRANHDQLGMSELYSAPTDGTSIAKKISGMLVADGGVIAPLTVSLDSSSVLFLSDKSANEVYELFVVPLDGGHQPLRAHPPLVDLPSPPMSNTPVKPTKTGTIYH